MSEPSAVPGALVNRSATRNLAAPEADSEAQTNPADRFFLLLRPLSRGGEANAAVLIDPLRGHAVALPRIVQPRKVHCRSAGRWRRRHDRDGARPKRRILRRALLQRGRVQRLAPPFPLRTFDGGVLSEPSVIVSCKIDRACLDAYPPTPRGRGGEAPSRAPLPRATRETLEIRGANTLCGIAGQVHYIFSRAPYVKPSTTKGRAHRRTHRCPDAKASTVDGRRKGSAHELLRSAISMAVISDD